MLFDIVRYSFDKAVLQQAKTDPRLLQ